MRRSIIALLGIASSSWAAEVPLDVLIPTLKEKQEPWFTGPLLSSSGNNIPQGKLNIEPYVFATYSSSSYNKDWKRVDAPFSSWNINLLAILQVGMTTWLDFTLTPSWFFSLANGATSFNLGDCTAAFGFQLYKQKKNGWIPSFRLLLAETFPIGRFENLDPEQFGTDLAGAGSYNTRAALALTWRLHLWDIHWTTIRMGAAYGASSKIKTHGYSAYGGAFDTNGWVYPGCQAQAFFGFEVNMTQRWVFAYDFLANFNTAIKFKGFPGFDELTGLPANLTKGSAAQFSMAPALEYNWNQNLGLISGVWFTFAGRNSLAFISWSTALNYFY